MNPEMMRNLANERHENYLADANSAREMGLSPRKPDRHRRLVGRVIPWIAHIFGHRAHDKDSGIAHAG